MLLHVRSMISSLYQVLGQIRQSCDVATKAIAGAQNIPAWIRPTQVSPTPTPLRLFFSRCVVAYGAGYTSSQKAREGDESGSEYHVAVQRATERARSNTRMRAGSQRAARSKIEVPSRTATLMKLGYPLAMLGIWAFNYLVFMQ